MPRVRYGDQYWTLYFSREELDLAELKYRDSVDVLNYVYDEGAKHGFRREDGTIETGSDGLVWRQAAYYGGK